MTSTSAREIVSLENRGRERVRLWLLLLLLPAPLIAFVGLPFAVRTAGVEAFVVEGPSMEPAIFQGERFASDKAAYGLFLPSQSKQSASWRSPKLGEVVVFKNPHGDFNNIKRVIGLAGDVIESREFDVLRNGVSLTVGPVDCPAKLKFGKPVQRCFMEQVGEHRHMIVFGRPTRAMPAVKVPKGHVYLLGDHRDASGDSRNLLGMVSTALMLGRATRIYWSDYRDRIGQAIE